MATAIAVIETAKLNALAPEAYIADLLHRLSRNADEEIDHLRPWTWRSAETAPAA